MAKKKSKRNPQDSTLRNVRATRLHERETRIHIRLLERRLERVEKLVANPVVFKGFERAPLPRLRGSKKPVK